MIWLLLVVLWTTQVTSFTASIGVPTSSELHATLVFDAKISSKSEALEETLLEQFLPTDQFRLHCLSAGGTSVWHTGAWDEELQSTFRELYGGAVPEANDDRSVLPESVHTVETSIPFPGGLQLHNTVTVASRFCTPSADHNNKNASYYENYLIAEEKRVSGPKPLVFLYNKLVQPTVGRTEPSGTAYTRIQKDADMIVTDSTVSIRVDFSDWLIRILPVSLEKMQQQGSMSVQKAVGKDIDKFMSSLATAMAEWHTGRQ